MVVRMSFDRIVLDEFGSTLMERVRDEATAAMETAVDGRRTVRTWTS